MCPLHLGPSDEAMLEGRRGPGHQTAMRIIADMAAVQGADRLIDITAAHIDGCLFHGQASLDFVDRLLAGGARVRVPTTLNVSSLDLLHPDLYIGDAATAASARTLMDRYRELGCEPTWTCAPYQSGPRPGFGEHVAWAESNAIAFANSVLGARTGRYGDFIDICAAVTGRVPFAGLHTDHARRGTHVFDVSALEPPADPDLYYPVLGHLIGRRVGVAVPVLLGFPQDAGEDDLKAFGAAAASSGGVGLFHAVGRTPEAPTLEAATGGASPRSWEVVAQPDLDAALGELSTAGDRALEAVSIGTPHFSVQEFERLIRILQVVPGRTEVEFYVSTGRAVLEEIDRRGWVAALDEAGVQIVTDTCTYVTPIIRKHRVVMTNSAKWAYYAPGNLGIDVVFGTLEDCVRSAMSGEIVRGER